MSIKIINKNIIMGIIKPLVKRREHKSIEELKQYLLEGYLNK